MEEMRATQEEQKRAGLLVDDAAPIKLSVHGSKPNPTAGGAHGTAGAESRVVFGQEDEEETTVKKKRVPLVELDFVVDGEKAKEKLETLRTQVTKDKDVLWKAKVRWEAISDVSFAILNLNYKLTRSSLLWIGNWSLSFTVRSKNTWGSLMTI
jgi:hypothetical protein